LSGTSLGASVSGQLAVWVFGKAMTSRMLRGAGHEHHHAIDAEGDAAVRRAAELQRIEQEAELLARFFLADCRAGYEHGLLHGAVVDADRAAADLGAVQHQVIGARQRALPGSRAGRRGPVTLGAVNG
jgi:hypothetical protein